LRTGWIAKEWSRRLGLPFVVRFEDIDRPRVVPGAEELQRRDLAEVGAVADRIDVQSAFGERHLAVFEAAVIAGKVYPCTCSRRQVKAALAAWKNLASAPHHPVPVYDGRCRSGATIAANAPVGWRWRADDPTGVDDVLVARTEGPRDKFQPSYHWACAIDDWDGRFQWIVRAWDLAPAVEPQRAVQRWLRAVEGSTDPLPRAFHAATVVDEHGQRLEKRSRGVTLPELFAAGWTGDAVADRFRASFESAVPAEGDGGEARREISVRELLG
jgi:glutamyl/glutaminyl-tRNA synthetase